MANLFIRTISNTTAEIMFFDETTGKVSFGSVKTSDNRYDTLRKLRKAEAKYMETVDSPCTRRVCAITSWVETKETRGMYESTFIDNSTEFPSRKDIPDEYAFSKEYKGYDILFDTLDPADYSFSKVTLFVTRESDIDKAKATYTKQTGKMVLKEVSRKTVSTFRAMSFDKFMALSRKMVDNFHFADGECVEETDEK